MNFEEFKSKVYNLHHILCPFVEYDNYEQNVIKMEELGKSAHSTLLHLEELTNTPDAMNIFEKVKMNTKHVNKLVILTTHYEGKLSMCNNGEEIANVILELQERMNIALHEMELERETERNESLVVFEQMQQELAIRKEKKEIAENKKNEMKIELPEKLTTQSLNELYELYNTNKTKCINSLLQYFYFWAPYTYYINDNYDFLDKLTKSEKVKTAVIFFIKFSNGTIKEKRGIDYDLSFHMIELYLQTLNLDIDEVIEIAKFYVLPPFPLVNCYHEDELFIDSVQQFLHVANCNIVNCYDANKKLFERVMNEKSKGEIKTKFISPSGEFIIYYLHSHILEEYSYFEMLLKINSNIDCVNLYVNDLNIVTHFIQSIYTGRFNESISDEITQNLYDLCDYCMISGIKLLCRIKLGENLAKTLKIGDYCDDDDNDSNIDENADENNDDNNDDNNMDEDENKNEN